MPFVAAESTPFTLRSAHRNPAPDAVAWRQPAIPSAPPRVLVIQSGNAVDFPINVADGEKLQVRFGRGLPKISGDGLTINVSLERLGRVVPVYAGELLPESQSDVWITSDWLALPTGDGNLVVSCGPGPKGDPTADWLALADIYVCKPEEYSLLRARQNLELRTKNEIAHFSVSYRLPMFTTKASRNASTHATQIIERGSAEEIVNFSVRARELTKTRELNVLTICCGMAATEAAIFTGAAIKPRITLCDINQDLLDGATEKLAGIALTETICADVNSVVLPRKKFDVAICVAGLHHIVELEHLFEQLAGCLRDGGEFWSIGEYVGRNGARLWPELYPTANAIFRALPDRYRVNNSSPDKRVDANLPNVDCSEATFEGIRAEEIEDQLGRRFREVRANRWSTICWKIISPSFVDNYDLDSEGDKELVEYLARIDVELLKSGTRHSGMRGIFVPL